MSKSKVFATVALGLSSALGVGVAQAADVHWSVTIGMPVYTQAVPVYVQPLPVYTQAVPVYVKPLPVYTRAAPVWVRPAPVYQRAVYQQPTRGDRDGDGIPNRHDRLYNPQWDRDGDGIPNRRDRLYNAQWDRDGDGIPNRYDQHAGRGWQGR